MFSMLWYTTSGSSSSNRVLALMQPHHWNWSIESPMAPVWPRTVFEWTLKAPVLAVFRINGMRGPHSSSSPSQNRTHPAQSPWRQSSPQSRTSQGIWSWSWCACTHPYSSASPIRFGACLWMLPASCSPRLVWLRHSAQSSYHRHLEVSTAPRLVLLCRFASFDQWALLPPLVVCSPRTPVLVFAARA